MWGFPEAIERRSELHAENHVTHSSRMRTSAEREESVLEHVASVRPVVHQIQLRDDADRSHACNITTLQSREERRQRFVSPENN